jgi:hypothetical protein
VVEDMNQRQMTLAGLIFIVVIAIHTAAKFIDMSLWTHPLITAILYIFALNVLFYPHPYPNNTKGYIFQIVIIIIAVVFTYLFWMN